jgi:hypothetical protein
MIIADLIGVQLAPGIRLGLYLFNPTQFFLVVT